MKIIFGLLIFFGSLGQLNAATMYQGVDISPMVEYYSAQVKVLNQPIVTYDWSKRGTPWGQWFKSIFERTNEPAQNDPRYLAHIREWSDVFWKTYGKESMNLYGYGLYLSVDPRATEWYGGNWDDWQLVQIKLPVGTRMIDFSLFSTMPDPNSALLEKVYAINRHFSCFASESNAESFFGGAGILLSPSCRALAHEVFNNVLKIDAIAYSYNSTDYEPCMGGDEGRAFVLLRADRLTSDDVRVYTADSRLNRSERRRIQTLLMSKLNDGKLLTSGGDDSVIWPDLEGEEKTPRIGEWLLKYKFGCNGRLPYAQP